MSRPGCGRVPACNPGPGTPPRADRGEGSQPGTGDVVLGEAKPGSCARAPSERGLARWVGGSKLVRTHPRSGSASLRVPEAVRRHRPSARGPWQVGRRGRSRPGREHLGVRTVGGDLSPCKGLTRPRSWPLASRPDPSRRAKLVGRAPGSGPTARNPGRRTGWGSRSSGRIRQSTRAPTGHEPGTCMVDVSRGTGCLVPEHRRPFGRPDRVPGERTGRWRHALGARRARQAGHPADPRLVGRRFRTPVRPRMGLTSAPWLARRPAGWGGAGCSLVVVVAEGAGSGCSVSRGTKGTGAGRLDGHVGAGRAGGGRDGGGCRGPHLWRVAPLPCWRTSHTGAVGGVSGLVPAHELNANGGPGGGAPDAPRRGSADGCPTVGGGGGPREVVRAELVSPTGRHRRPSRNPGARGAWRPAPGGLPTAGSDPCRGRRRAVQVGRSAARGSVLGIARRRPGPAIFRGPERGPRSSCAARRTRPAVTLVPHLGLGLGHTALHRTPEQVGPPRGAHLGDLPLRMLERK